MPTELTPAQQKVYDLVRQAVAGEGYDDQPLGTPEEVHEAVGMLYSESVRLRQVFERLDGQLREADERAAYGEDAEG
ncbi:hypothetical protein [Pseudomonas reactans]|uniref:hypothetical protein n=1 Tax=Pseudomonas reactans TaxID=117680 RepID=UPI00159FCAAD|nr:hypothetical protein [Pseudomonas reactans]NWC89978.1 hypothetical protein [Pseudomonas reactans]